MPGSPAISTTEAATSPPPRTRSIPPKPVDSLTSSASSASERGTGPPSVGPAARSATVPHASQDGHRPTHCPTGWPQARHANAILTFATPRAYREAVTSLPGGPLPECRRPGNPRAAGPFRPYHPQASLRTGREEEADGRLRLLLACQLHRRSVGWGGRLEHDLAVLGIHDDRLSRRVFLPQQLLGQGILHHPLDGSTERTRTERGIVALLGKQAFGPVGEDNLHVLGLQLLADALHHQVDDGLHVLLGERVEHDDLVDPVQELGTEGALQLFHHLVLHLLVRDLLVGRR